MSPSANTLQREQARLLEALGNAAWLRGVGIGLVRGEPGLVISATTGASELAVRAVRDAALTVPYRIRELGRVRKRTGDD